MGYAWTLVCFLSWGLIRMSDPSAYIFDPNFAIQHRVRNNQKLGVCRLVTVATCRVPNCCRQTGRTEFKFSYIANSSCANHVLVYSIYSALHNKNLFVYICNRPRQNVTISSKYHPTAKGASKPLPRNPRNLCNNNNNKAKFFGLDERTSAGGKRGARDRDISSRDIRN